MAAAAEQMPFAGVPTRRQADSRICVFCGSEMGSSSACARNMGGVSNCTWVCTDHSALAAGVGCAPISARRVSVLSSGGSSVTIG